MGMNRSRDASPFPARAAGRRRTRRGTGAPVAATKVPPTANITPDRVSAAVSQLDHLAQEVLDRTGIPGLAIAVVYGDENPYLNGFGTRDAGQDLPVDADTIFQLASVSKPFSSTVIAGLVGDGVVSWDDKLTDLNPDFRLIDPWVTSQVTVRDMYCHRSGLPEHGGDLLEDLGFDRAEVLHRLRFMRPNSSFRSHYAYTNFGMTAAALAVAKAAGTDWETLAARRLYEPLALAHTSSRFADFIASPNHAAGHMLVDNVWTAKEQRDPDAQSPAGGVSSTVRDLARWMRLQLGGGTIDGVAIIAAAALAETHQPQIVSAPSPDPATRPAEFYGLGWNVGYRNGGIVFLSHSGAFALGAGTAVYLHPAYGLGIAVLTNASPIGAAETIALEFLDLVQFGAISRNWVGLLTQAFAEMNKAPYGTAVHYAAPPADAPPPLPLDAYIGSYANDLYGPLAIDQERGSLVLRLGPKMAPYPLTHYARDVFSFQPIGENAYGPSGVIFAIGAAGRADSLVVEYLDVHGQGTFTRTASAA
jgi:CubicO group peptidase (beta-lactamase class C family)